MVSMVSTCTGHPHEAGEYAVRPFVGGEIVFSIQLAQTDCLGVQGKLLKGHTESRDQRSKFKVCGDGMNHLRER